MSQADMERMKRSQHMQAIYVRKMQALPGKVLLAALLCTLAVGTRRAYFHTEHGDDVFQLVFRREQR